MKPRGLCLHGRVRIGLYVSADAATPVETLVDRFRRADALGFHTAWAGQLFDHDALLLLALAAQATRRIELGSWVLPVQPRHPVVLAQQALTLQAASRGRLLLGLGVGHAEVVERRLGLSSEKPVACMREYLEVLRPLLARERVEHVGARLRLALRLDGPEAPPPPLFVAALGPQMLRLAGRRADGVAIWLGGPRYLEEFALPRVGAAAREAGRPPPRIACGLPVAVTAHRERARASADALLARSARLPAYRRVLERERADSPAAVALLGDESAVARQLDHLGALGVTDFTAWLFPVEGDEEAPERTRALLAELAGSHR